PRGPRWGARAPRGAAAARSPATAGGPVEFDGESGLHGVALGGCEVSGVESTVQGSGHEVSLVFAETLHPGVEVESGDELEGAGGAVHRPLEELNLGPDLLGAGARCDVPDLLQFVDAFLPAVAPLHDERRGPQYLLVHACKVELLRRVDARGDVRLGLLQRDASFRGGAYLGCVASVC